MMKKLALTLPIAFICSCSWSKDGFYVKSQHTTMPALAPDAPVFITREVDFPKCKITRIAEVKVSRRQYGSESQVKQTLEQRAREMGGNLVLGYNFWVAPSGWAWAAPHGEGTIAHGSVACVSALSKKY